MRVMSNSIWKNSRQKEPSELMSLVAKNDDHKAFEELYRVLHIKLYQFVYFIVLDEQKAQDLVHDAFLSLYDKRKSYRQEYKVTTWLWTIARNKSYDYLKKSKEACLKDEILFNIEDETNSALEQLIDSATSKNVSEALIALPESQREAILMWMDDYTGEEIADVLGKSKQASKNLINRAKVKLKELLEKELESL